LYRSFGSPGADLLPINGFPPGWDTGGLKFTGHDVPVGNPSQILFLDLGKRSR
jgi:hypothetical protein